MPIGPGHRRGRFVEATLCQPAHAQLELPTGSREVSGLHLGEEALRIFIAVEQPEHWGSQVGAFEHGVECVDPAVEVGEFHQQPPIDGPLKREVWE
jgi:hypothetical protein